jgi:hypothetical protein
MAFKDPERRKTYVKEYGRRHFQQRKATRPFHNALLAYRSRAVKNNFPVDVDEEYLKSIWTGHCAISNLPIRFDISSWDDLHAELDKINPSLGYTKGNVAWVSRKYNRMKSDSSIEDLQLIAQYLKKQYGT